MLFELDECFDANFHAAIVQSHSRVIRNFGAAFKRIQNRFFSQSNWTAVLRGLRAEYRVPTHSTVEYRRTRVH